MPRVPVARPTSEVTAKHPSARILEPAQRYKQSTKSGGSIILLLHIKWTFEVLGKFNLSHQQQSPPEAPSSASLLSFDTLESSKESRETDREGKTEMEEDNFNDIYRECLRNHAATLGSYATDGCGEFTPDDTSPGGLRCVACGCHRNFHRKINYGAGYSSRSMGHAVVAEVIEYGGAAGGGGGGQMVQSPESERSSKKRFRTKFTEEQKEKMLEFAEKLGWKLQRKDEEDETERFCRGIGISRKVFKVWMHNHKNSSSASASTGNASSLTQ